MVCEEYGWEFDDQGVWWSYQYSHLKKIRIGKRYFEVLLDMSLLPNTVSEQQISEENTISRFRFYSKWWMDGVCIIQNETMNIDNEEDNW